MTLTIKPVKEIAREARMLLKYEYPKCKFSIVSDHNHITISLLEAPFKAVNYETRREWDKVNDEEVYRKIPFSGRLNLYYGDFYPNRNYEDTDFRAPYNFDNEGEKMITKEAFDVLKRAVQVVSVYNWDRSDIQSDYFDVHFYLAVEIGRWDRDFRQV